MDVASLTVKVVNEGLDTTAKGLDDLGKSAKGAAKEAEKSVSSFEKMEKSVKGFNESMSGLRNAGLVIGGALTGVLYKSVNAAKEFESAMADVKKVVDFDTPDGLENMRDELLELSKQIPITAEGFAQIAAAAGQSGIAADEIIVFAEAAAKMGTAFDISADQAGQAMAEMRVAFKMSQDEVGGLVDKINYLGDSTPNSAAKILEIVQRIGPLGEIAGVSADQIAALGASITSLEPEVVATGLKNMMLRMTAGAAATKPMKAAWHDLGFTAQEVALGMQEDSEAMVNAVLSAVKKLPKEEQAAYINTLFGQEAIGVISQLVTNGELLEQNMMAIGDATKYAGSAQKEFETRSATTENQMVLMGNNINTAWIAIGDAVLPVLNNIIEAVIPVIERMADWAKENPELVQGIIIVTGAISGLLLGVTGLGLAISGAISIFSGLAAVGGVLATALGFVSLPMIAIVAAIAGIVGAGYMLYKHWDEIKAFASETWDSVKNSASEAWEGVTSSVSGLVDDTVASFQDLGSSISDNWSSIKSSTSQNWESIKSTMVSGAQSAIAAAKSAFASLPAPIQNVLTIVYNVVKTQLDLVRNIFSTVLSAIKAAVRGDMQGVVDAFKTGMSNAWNIIKTGATNIVNAIKDLGTRLFRAGVDAVQGLINGIKSKIAGVKSAASELGQAAWGGVKSFLQIRSPSRKMAELGKNTAEGLAKGIKDNKKKPVSEAQKMAEQAVKAVKDTIATLQRDIALFGNDDPIAAMLWDKANTDKYKGVGDALFNEAVGLTKRKKELEDNAKAADKLAAANKSIEDSIISMDRQLYELAAERNPYELLLWDLEHTKKYADAGAEAVELLKSKTKELFEEQERQAAIKKAKEASDAMSQMLGGLGGEKSPLQRLQDEQDERLRIIQESMIAEGGMKQAHTDALLAIDERYEQDLQKLKLAQYSDGLGLFTRFMGSMLGENKRAKRIMFGIEKGFALATILIENKKALAKAWASAPFPYNLPIVAKTAMQTGAISAALDAVSPKGFKQGGYTGSIGANNVAGVVHGNEYVFDAQSTKAIGVENLERIRRGKGTGEVNITVNNHSSAKVETETDSQGNIIMTIRDEVKRSWSNLQNPNSHESKMLGRNVQAPRRR